MAFNFWEAQRKARGRTKLYAALFLLMTVGTALGVEWAMRTYAGDSYDPPLPFLGIAFVVVTLGTTLFNYSMYGQYGGSYVAESVGGRLVSPATTDFKERQLLNIVEEMSIAAGVPMPKVYILPVNQINAFAAGLKKEQAAIAITQGSLQTLSREEVQGVIAHEFGHIYNGDMRISLQLAAMVMGFFIVLYLGMRLLQIASFTRGERDGNGDRKGGNPLAIAGLILIIAGILTWFLGSLLKCAVSRQREYLADACSVQFTRNPTGIANALKKIGQQTETGIPSDGMAFSHLYFDDHGGLSSLFATHPPLWKRIAAIEGLTYLPPEWKEQLFQDKDKDTKSTS